MKHFVLKFAVSGNDGITPCKLNTLNKYSDSIAHIHTGYPETTNATDNNKRSENQQVGTGCKYLSGIKLSCSWTGIYSL